MNEQQINEMRRVKAYFPFRRIFAVIYKETAKFEVHAMATLARANRLAREGHQVFILECK